MITKPDEQTEASAKEHYKTFTVSFRGRDTISNRQIDDAERTLLHTALAAEEVLHFLIVGDLDRRGRYAKSMLAVTDRRVIGFDPSLPDGQESYPYDTLSAAAVRRFYGNAVLTVTPAGEGARAVNLLRFSYRAAPLFDAAAQFITAVAGGGEQAAELDAVAASFEKQFSYCPKCGRSLIRPGAPCANCQSKHHIIKKLISYVAPYKVTLFVCLALSVVTTAVALLPPYMTKTLVDDVLPGGKRDMLLRCVLILLGTYVVQYGVGTVRSYFLRVCGDRVVSDLRRDVYEKAQKLPMLFYDHTSTGSVINRISGDSNNIQSFMLRMTQEVVVQLFMLVGIAVIMFAMNWKLTLLSLIPVPFVVIGARRFGKKVAPYYRRIWRRWSSVSSILTDTIPGVRVIKAFCGEEKSVSNFEARNNEWLKTDIAASRITTLFPQLVSFAITCGSLLIWGVGGTWAINGTAGISAGLLVSFLSYTSMFYGPVSFFANLNDSYQSTLNSAERIFDIIDAEPEADFAQGKHPDALYGSIEFRNVNFSFDRSKKTLDNVSFTIDPGDIVGVVGTTGSGKSTLVNLLMRYYDRYDGDILVDGINIRDIDMQFYRSQIGYVQQEPLLFHDTVYNNIAFGSENKSVWDVIQAARVANAHAFISRLPDAYDTVLGERGVGLSGGERQRLSIARAVLKDPRILFFDEATASVDSETESQIQSAIEELIKGRTTIMIAHRLSTLRKATKIIVVDDGHILECGTPQELLAQQGKYYKLVQIQTMSDEIQRTKKEEGFE